MKINSNLSALTQINFEMLLNWLDKDREAAGFRYEAIRFKLRKFFAARGSTHAQELADETIDRVLKKTNVLRQTYEGDPLLYFLGVAKNVFHEYTRRVVEKELPGDIADFDDSQITKIEQMHKCLNNSLNKIPPEQREFILDYYSWNKSEKIRRRKEISKDLNISCQTMHVHAFRIRSKIQKIFIKDFGQPVNIL